MTGGGSGIGRELVLDLLNRGARVAALDMSEQGLNETAGLAREKREGLSTHVVNITDRPAVEALPSAISYRVMAWPDVKLMDWLSRLSPLRAATIIYKQMKELLPA